MSDLQCNPLSLYWIENEVDISQFSVTERKQSFQFILLSPLHDCSNPFYTERKTRTVANIEAHCKLRCIMSNQLNVPFSKYVNHVLRLTHSMYIDIYNSVTEAQLGGGGGQARAPPPCRMKRKKEWRKSVSQE